MTPPSDQNGRRLALQQAIADLPDEAFSWLTLALWSRPPLATQKVWPDGELGGFSAESRAGILRVLDAATQLATNGADHYVPAGEATPIGDIRKPHNPDAPITTVPFPTEEAK